MSGGTQTLSQFLAFCNDNYQEEILAYLVPKRVVYSHLEQCMRDRVQVNSQNFKCNSDLPAWIMQATQLSEGITKSQELT